MGRLFGQVGHGRQLDPVQGGIKQFLTTSTLTEGKPGYPDPSALVFFSGVIGVGMEVNKKLTEEEREQRRAMVNEWQENRNSAPEVVSIREDIKRIFNSEDEVLCNFVAHMMIDSEKLNEAVERLSKDLNRILYHSEILSINSDLPNKIKSGINALLLKRDPGNPASLIYAQVTQIRNLARVRGKNAADANHNKPGGSREKKLAIVAAWATGKFDSRTRCAEEECAGLNMSFDAARRALRNTPEPPSRCAE